MGSGLWGGWHKQGGERGKEANCEVGYEGDERNEVRKGSRKPIGKWVRNEARMKQ